MPFAEYVCAFAQRVKQNESKKTRKIYKIFFEKVLTILNTFVIIINVVGTDNVQMGA